MIAVTVAAADTAAGFGSVAETLSVGAGSIKGRERQERDVDGTKSGKETRDASISVREVFSFEMSSCCSLRSAKAVAFPMSRRSHLSPSFLSPSRLTPYGLTIVVRYSSLVNFR